MLAGPANRESPFSAFLGKRVRVLHLKGEVIGEFRGIREQFLELDVNGKQVFVGVRAVVTIE